MRRRFNDHALSAILRRLRQVPADSRAAGGRTHRPAMPRWGLFRITGIQQDGSNKRWVYTAKRLGVKTGAGYAAAWPDDTRDTDDYTLYSLAEKNNTNTGIYGNGVSQANLDAINDSGGGTDGTFDLKPLPPNSTVLAVGVYLDNGNPEWWIVNFPNGVDGACPS